MIKSQPIFHDLPKLNIDMNFNMTQYAGVKDFLKGFIRTKRLLYIRPSELTRMKKLNDLDDFELTIFYTFEEAKSGINEGKTRFKSKVHNVLVVRAHRPVLVLFNPFQHVTCDSKDPF